MAMITEQIMSSSSVNVSSFDDIAIKIGGKTNAKIIGYEIMYGAATQAKSKNFDMMRILMENYHLCKRGCRFIF